MDGSGDTLTLGKTQRYERAKETTRALQAVHGDGNELVGAWAFINHNKSKRDQLFSQSKSVSDFSLSVPCITKSLTVMYKGGVMNKRKYQALRSSGMADLFPYGKLIEHVNGLRRPEIFSFPTIDGQYSNLEEHVRLILEYYIKLDKSQNNSFQIDWMGKPNHFQLAFGGDGAPIGTTDGATSMLVSVLNAGQRIQSRDHNHLVCLAGTGKESHPEIQEYLCRVGSWIQKIENSGMEIENVQYSVSFELLPCDQKFLTIMAGELSNSATYPSTFANIHKDDLKKFTPGPIQTWSYAKRLSDAAKVRAFKLKNPLSARTKITKQIASLKSRQEFLPPIGKVVDKALIDPLHVKNNTWEKVNRLIVAEVVTSSKAHKSQKLSDLANDDPVKVYHSALKTIVKAGKVAKKFVNWFDNERANSDFSCRFTGEDSTKVANNYLSLLKKLVSTPLSSQCVRRFHVIAYMAFHLSQVTVIMSKFNPTPDGAELAEKHAGLYFAAHNLFLDTVGLQEWTLAYVVPAHVRQASDRFDKGLGVNSTQGREAKHQAIKAYKAKTSPQTLYAKIMTHEYIDCLYLPTLDPSLESYTPSKRELIVLNPGDCTDIHLCDDPQVCHCSRYMSIIHSCCQARVVSSEARQWFNASL